MARCKGVRKDQSQCTSNRAMANGLCYGHRTQENSKPKKRKGKKTTVTVNREARTVRALHDTMVKRIQEAQDFLRDRCTVPQAHRIFKEHNEASRRMDQRPLLTDVTFKRVVTDLQAEVSKEDAKAAIKAATEGNRKRCWAMIKEYALPFVPVQSGDATPEVDFDRTALTDTEPIETPRSLAPGVDVGAIVAQAVKAALLQIQS